MQITLETDYAVRIVICLARKGNRMDSKEISENSDVTERFSLKILRKLVSAGIIRSYRGIQGGYELAKDPKNISLYDVVGTVEGDLAVCRCLKPGFICDHVVNMKSSCPVKKVYNEISQMVIDKMKSVSIAELIE